MLFINSLSKSFFSIISLISFFDLTSFSSSRMVLKSFIKVTEPVSNRSKKSRYVSSKSTLNGITQQISHFSQTNNILPSKILSVLIELLIVEHLGHRYLFTNLTHKLSGKSVILFFIDNIRNDKKNKENCKIGYCYER